AAVPPLLAIPGIARERSQSSPRGVPPRRGVGSGDQLRDIAPSIVGNGEPRPEIALSGDDRLIHVLGSVRDRGARLMLRGVQEMLLSVLAQHIAQPIQMADRLRELFLGIIALAAQLFAFGLRGAEVGVGLVDELAPLLADSGKL